MIQTFEIPKPPSANSIWRSPPGSTHPLLSAGYRKWLRIFGSYLRLQDVHPQPTPTAFWLVIVGGKGWRTNNDLDNRIKSTLDGLVRNHIIKDDSTKHIVQEHIIYQSRLERNSCCRCFVRLTNPTSTWFDDWEIPSCKNT